MTTVENIKVKQYYSSDDVDFVKGEDVEDDPDYWSFYDSVADLIEKATGVEGISNYGFESGFDSFLGKGKTYYYDSEGGAFCAYLYSEKEVKDFIENLNLYLSKVIMDLNVLTDNV